MACNCKGKANQAKKATEQQKTAEHRRLQQIRAERAKAQARSNK